MGGGSRAEAVVGTPEVADGTQPLAEDRPHSAPALDARVETMDSFPGLGPPDIVYVRKRFRPTIGQAANYGFYHFIRGADSSSPAALSSYIYALLNAGLDPAPWLATGSWEIVGATIHSYNAISKRDAVVDIALPGGISAYSVGSDAELVPAASEAQDSFWQETAVCAVARAISNVGETPAYPCMRAVSPLQTPEAEASFLETAAACIKRWRYSGTDRPGVTEATAANSRIAVAIASYFMDDARYAAAQAFFDSDAVLVADPETGALAARAANKAGLYEEAERITSTVLELNASAADAWLAKSETLALQDDVGGAMTAAHKATECAPEDLTTWIALANLYVVSGDYESAFVALNSADMPPPPLDPYLRHLVPNRRNVTTPLKGGDQARAGAVRALTQRLREERNASTTKADELLAELPGKLMSKTERDVYLVLVKIQIAVGWDELLAIRGRCFVMEADIVGASGGSGADGEIDSSGDSEGDSFGHRRENGFAGDGSAEATAGIGKEVEQKRANNNAGDSTADVSVELSAVSLSEVGTDDIQPDEDKLKENGNGDMNGPTVLHFEPNWSKNKPTLKNGAVREGEVANGDDGDASDLPISQRALDDIGKKVCKPWLDYLVTNLYEDLRALAIWKAEEDNHRRVTASTAAAAASAESPGEAAAAYSRGEDPEDVESGVTEEAPRPRTADEIAETTRRPPVDWLRRGELGLRLHNQEMATTAFLVCIRLSEKMKEKNISSFINLMTISAADGLSKPTMRCADSVMAFVDHATEYQAKHKSLDAYAETPPVVRNALHTLISKVGLNAVRAAMPSRMDVNHSRLEGLLLDAVVWKCHGYDR